MRKVRERLCLIVCGGGGGVEVVMWGWGRRGSKLSSVGLLLLQAIFVCVCVCVCEREGDVRRYEIQLRGSLLLFIFFCDEWHVAKILKV